eukprot:g388.t1
MFHAQEEKPKFRATKLPLSFPLLALNQRIFVEEVLEAPPTTPLYVGDEIREVNHRPVSSLKKGEFFQLFDQALYGGVFKLHRGSLDCYFQNRRSPEGTSVSAELSVFCIIASMSDEEVLALRVAGGTTAGELKQQVERQLHVPTFCQQLVHERRALEETGRAKCCLVIIAAPNTADGPGVVSGRGFDETEASGIHADLGLAFCDPAFLPPGRVAVAAVAPAAWLEILQFLGEEDFDDLADGQVVAVLPRDDYDALVRLGPLNFLFHSADVHRSEPHIPQESFAQNEAFGAPQTKELATRAMDAVPNLEAMSLDRLGELELQLQRLQQSHLQRQADSRAEVEGLEERVVSGFEGHQHLQEALKGLQEQQEQLQLRCGALEAQLLELPKAQEKAFLEMSQQDSQVAKDLRGLQARLEATEGLLSGARSNEQSLQEDLEQLKTDCSKEFAFAQSTWARIIDWQAQVDVATLQQHGKLDLSSPKFSAAGLENLVLHLRLQAGSH